MLENKDCPYDMRNPEPLVQPKKNTTNFGLRFFNYLAPRLWNQLLSNFHHVKDFDEEEFRFSLKNGMAQIMIVYQVFMYDI